jgi:hypothetical protein
MTCPSRHRSIRLKPIAALAVLSWIACATCSGAMADGTVKLDEFTKPLDDQGTLTLKGIEFVDTNLSEAEIRTILSATKPGDADALVAKLNAASIAISEGTLAGKDHTFTIRNIKATDVKQGKIARVSIGSIEGHGEVQDAGTATFKVGSVTIDQIDFRAALPALAGATAPPTSPVEAERMVLSDVDMTVPDAETPKAAPGGNLYRIKLASLTVATTRGEVTTTTAILDKLVIVPPKFSQAGQSLAQIGYDEIDFDAKFSGRHDRKARSYAIEDLSIGWAGVGSIGFEAKLGGIDEAAMNGGQDAMAKALAEADISHLAIRLTNAGYFEKAVAEEAARQNKTAEEIKAFWRFTLLATLPIDPANPTAKKITDAVSAFIANPKNLTITFDAKGAPIKFSDFSTLTSPDDLLALVDINAVANQ